MITIARMKEIHLDEVEEIEQDTFSMPWSLAGYRTALEQESNLFYVAMDDNKVVGYCGAYVSDYEGEITNVAIREDRRNGHIGSLMLEHMLQAGLDVGITDWYLEVRASNAAAIYVYKKLGFKEIGRRAGFYTKPTEDGLVMRKRISKEQKG